MHPTLVFTLYNARQFYSSVVSAQCLLLINSLVGNAPYFSIYSV
jgi:hypothetical protein